MQAILEMLPKVAQDTKKTLTTAIQNQQSGKVNTVRLAELISSKHNEELIEALRMLIGLYIQNRDMDVFMSRVINLLPRDDLELKRLCQILITEVAALPRHLIENNNKNGDVLLLSISPIFKDIVSFKTGIKLYALKSLPLLNIPETTPLLLASLNKIVVDKNPLVRRVAGISIMKVYDVTKGEIEEEEYWDAIEFLLKDNAQVRCGAVTTLMYINKDSTLKWMHTRYALIIKDLPLLHNLDMERSIRYLNRYALQYFSFCKESLNVKKGVPRPKDTEDLILLLDQTQKLLILPYPAVIVAIAALHIDFPQESRLKQVIKTLTRFLNISSESKYVILQTLYRYAQSYPHLVREYFRSFTINQIEKLYCKVKKLEILLLLVDETNHSAILEEILHHTRSNQPQLVATAVRILGQSAQLIPKFIKKTIRALVDVLRSGSRESKNHVVEAFCRIMNSLPSPQLLPLLTLCLQYLDDVSDIRYKCYVIRLLNRENHLIPSIATENLRKLTLQFLTQHENVKYEILSLAQSLSSISNENSLFINQIFQYLLTLSQFDPSILVRDLARAIESIKPQIIHNVTIIYNKISEIIQCKPIATNQYTGYLSDMGLNDLQRNTRKQVYDISNESTQNLRQILEVKPEIKPTEPKPQIKQNIVPQQNIIEDPKKKKKELEEEVKKHYNNLENVLNDFFVDEE